MLAECRLRLWYARLSNVASMELLDATSRQGGLSNPPLEAAKELG